MGALLSYSIITSIALFFCYLPYRWFMADRKQYAFNRLMIFAAYGLSLLSPFLIFSSNPDPKNIISGVSFGMPYSQIHGTANSPTNGGVSIWEIIVIAYAIGFAYVTFRYFLGTVRILFIIKKSHRIDEARQRIMVSDCNEITPFNWGNIIVIGRQFYDSEQKAMILTHESAHIKLRHWVDLLVGQAIVSLQWFNPAAWMLRDCLREVHEYQADEYVLMQGMNPRKYKLFLVATAFSSKYNLPVNFLSTGNIRKRINMMGKCNAIGINRLTAVALIPFLCVGALACCLTPVKVLITQIHGITISNVYEEGRRYAESKIEPINQSIVEAATETHSSAEDFIKAEYIDGQEALMSFITKNTKYPREAEANMIQGEVIVSFEISSEGDVISVGINTSAYKCLDDEALRVCRMITHFKPAKLNGSPVGSTYDLPINFKLSCR